ncbi:hypothetical protein VSDG_09132 [Cytospora chrysosperma]|uniref:C2H2-type domain-containing protein n=1 Tax=Cytospora chrysosperma TaxID=252740 RepID=A0A423VCG7_CYTCH|nr:hypothetical protein VSDG_09132 [Valsa sordida]
MKRSREPEDDPDPTSTDQQDVAIVPISKIVGLDDDGPQESREPEMKCSLPGHSPGLTFVSYKDYESHYNKAHTTRCLDCRKSFPSSHILDLHIDEFHNVLTELKKEKGEATFACFVETCDEKCKTPAERRAHLIERHMYPANYFFAVTKVGIDRRQSMLVERKQGKPPAKQRDGGRPRGQKADRKTGKKTNADTNNGGTAHDPIDVAMQEPDEPSRHGQRASQMNAGEKASADDEGVPMNEPDKPIGEGIEKAAADTEMEDLAGAMSSLNRSIWSKEEGWVCSSVETLEQQALKILNVSAFAA